MGGTQTADIFDQLHAQAPASTPFAASSHGDIFDQLHAGGGKINPAAAPGAYQTRPGGTVQNVNDTRGQRTNYAGLTEIVPKEGETFADTIKRAIAHGRTVTPEQIAQQTRADMKVAPAVAVAAPMIGAAGSAAIAGAGELAGTLGGPTVARTSVGTGILDAAGNEIMKDVATYGPSLLRQYGAKALLPILKYAARGAGMGAGYKALDWIVKNL